MANIVVAATIFTHFVNFTVGQIDWLSLARSVSTWPFSHIIKILWLQSTAHWRTVCCHHRVRTSSARRWNASVWNKLQGSGCWQHYAAHWFFPEWWLCRPEDVTENTERVEQTDRLKANEWHFSRFAIRSSDSELPLNLAIRNAHE